MADAIAWSRKSIDELVTFYEREIGDAMVRDGMDPTADRPTYEWLADRGYSGIAYALREQHDLTLSEFFTECVEVDPPESDGYDWGIGDVETVDRLEQYLYSRSKRHNLADATIRSGAKPALSAPQVRQLHRAAASDAERFMVVALGAWGLRRSEVASLHAASMDTDASPPRLTFAERKNGPGTVQVLFGMDAYADRVAAFEDGDGERPTPHACRRFWYNAYLRASRAALEQASAVGAEQGSSSAEVVLENYIDEEQALAMRREHMRATLAEAFDADEGGA